ncbi:hypothetical protein [Streptomyces sp. NPDC127098]|uniref:hypothetical protein n=1 Tax=Streptomyces sp. NPDC127098 TaxID=3347137 RepID=UPI003661DABD
MSGTAALLIIEGMHKTFAFVAAPLLITAYGLIRALDGLDGERGPGPAWTTGHLAFLLALLLFVPVLREMRRLTGGRALATATLVIALVGVTCSLAQVSIDLVIGLLAADHDDMRRMFTDVHNLPGMDVAVYEAGPVLFFLGLLVLACHLAAARAVPAWRAAAVSLAVLVAPIDLDLLPAVGLLLLVGLAPFPRGARPAAARS